MTNDEMTFLPLTLIRSAGLPLDAWASLAPGMPDWTGLQNAEQVAAEQLLQSFDETLFQVSDGPFRTAVYNARKGFFQRRKLPSKNFEAMLHKEECLAQLLENLYLWKKSQAEKQEAEYAFEQQLAANYKAMQALAKEENLRRALLFASHDLLVRIPEFAKKAVNDFDKKDRQISLSILQYLTRAVFKTSPLGRFTTIQVCGMEGLATNRPLQMLEPERVGEWFGSKVLVSPNVALLPAIYEVLLREPAFFQSLSVSLNPCVVPTELSESSNLTGSSSPAWLYFDGEREAFQQIDPDPVAGFLVNTLLEHQREMPFQQLVKVLENEVEATNEQLQALLFKLIEIGLLEWRLPEHGLSPAWSNRLYNYLAQLPSSPAVSEAAYLLQWLRSSARNVPFQNMEEVMALQRETVVEAKTFLERHGVEMPPIPPEQIFFEDVAQDHAVDWPSGTLEKLIGQLADCWQQKAFHSTTPFRARLINFAQKAIPEGQHIDFLAFSQRFLEVGEDVSAAFVAETPRRLKSPVQPRHRGKVGALLQIFQENGEYKAAVNAMYPGPGKMFARWLPLFSEEFLAQIKSWSTASSSGGFVLAFPWQGWSNANFQPAFLSNSLAVPDNRVGHLPDGRTILLGDLAVRNDEQGCPQLIEKQSNSGISFNDLGLEAPETRPPVMQVLWHLGVPFVSAESLLPKEAVWEQFETFRYRSRVEYQSLVLARECWELRHEVWEKLFSKRKSQAEQIGLAIAALKAMGIPSRFFGQFTGRREKPQFYDMGSPISMLLLEKNLRGGSGNLLFTEMLPTPAQWLGDRAMEFVVEFWVE